MDGISLTSRKAFCRFLWARLGLPAMGALELDDGL